MAHAPRAQATDFAHARCYMTRLLYITLLLFSCCCEAQESAPPKWKPGQVLAEKKEDLGFGFSLIHRSIVNPPSHWEGVGHFSFVYFEKRQLCQCGRSEFSISPSGRYALLQDGPSGKLLLFTTHLDKISEVTKQYVVILPRHFRTQPIA
jgi:hypothetical protein